MFVDHYTYMCLLQICATKLEAYLWDEFSCIELVMWSKEQLKLHCYPHQNKALLKMKLLFSLLRGCIYNWMRWTSCVH